MYKVVLDTNIIISATLTPAGNPAKIVNMALDKTIQINLNDEILAEYEEVLSRKEFSFSSEEKSALMAGIRRSGIINKPSVSSIPMPDEDDRIFYDTAKETGAILITGNTKHYPIETFIMKPSDFLNLLKSSAK